MAARGSIKAPPDPDRQILVTLPQSKMLKLVSKAEAAGVCTHDWVQSKLLELANG